MFKPTNTTIGLIAAAAVFVLGISISWAFDGKSPEELRMEAALARIEAMKADCETIADRVVSCFTSSDKSTCVQMQESYAWFTSEYQESPDFACSTNPDPLAFGATQE